MKRITMPLLVWSITILAILSGCGKSKESTNTTPVTFKTTKLADKSSFKRSNGELCQIKIDAAFQVPDTYQGKPIDAKLQKLITATLFEGGDTLQQAQALQQIIHSRLADNASNATDAAEEDEPLPVSNIDIKIKVSPVYNANGILSMCFEEVISKDGVASTVHSYFNYDLEHCTLVDVGEFTEQSLADMAQLLQNKLMEQNKVTSAEELSMLGYFDIFNISVTSNFYFSDKGLVWSYKPQESTADAQVEPTITVPFADLKPFVKENSVIKKLM
ncbi:MAG: RsiV family protein [Sodaliphilus sp.]